MAPHTTPRGTQPRRWWFRVLALFSPIFLMGLGELGLRLAGYGYATHFFLEARQGNQTWLTENPKFGWRFFPPAIARTPQPISFPAAKPAGTVRIFVFGESAALGDPEPSYGFSRQLERLLAARFPEKKFEVINTAMTAVNSHVIRQIARDCVPLHGDFWLVYAGNNEVVGPFGAGTIFGRQAPPLSAVRASLVLKSTRLGQWLSSLRARPADFREWQGMEMFLQNQVRRDAPGLQIVRQNFSRNLADILELGQRSGATVIVSTVPVNLRDCPPFASMHSSGLSEGELADWKKNFDRGRADQDSNQFADAIAAYNDAEKIDGSFAEIAFRKAVGELSLGEKQIAATNFSRARDLDSLRFRADSRLNQIIRRAASGSVALIDGERECNEHSPDEIAGETLFLDHVHLNFSGNYLIAKLFAGEIEKHLASASASPREPWLSEIEVAQRLAFTEFDRRRIGEEMQLRLRQPPFSSQLNAARRDQQWQHELNELTAPPSGALAPWSRINATPYSTGRAEYRAALERAPGDWMLHANFARLQEAVNDPASAMNEWRQVARLLPCEPEPWFELGNLAYNSHAYADAQNYFQEAVKRKSDLLEAQNGLGLSLSAQGKEKEAIGHFNLVLRIAPSFSAARVNLAVMLADRGETSAAMREYRTTLQLDTNNVAARINLAKLLASQKKLDEAIALLKEALALRPDEPMANFNLANALVAQNRHAEAIPCYQAAVLAKDDFAEAHFDLAIELVRAGNLSAAVPQFAKVVELQPDFLKARFNYGVALAKQKRYAEAATQFEEILVRQPDNSEAKAALERARQRAGARENN